MLSTTLLFQSDSFGGDESRGRLRTSTVQFISCGQDKVSGVSVVFFKRITYERVDPGSGFALLGAKQDMKGLIQGGCSMNLDYCKKDHAATRSCARQHIVHGSMNHLRKKKQHAGESSLKPWTTSRRNMSTLMKVKDGGIDQLIYILVQVYPAPSNSHHQDYYMFSKESL